MSGNKKWTKKGYEVHTSKDGETWYGLPGERSKRPMYAENELRTAKKDFKSAQRDNKFVRLIKLEMNYELLEVSQTAETETERKAKILAAIKELFKDDPAVNAHECSFVSMDTLNISPTQVRIEIRTEKLECGPRPKRKDFPAGPEGKPLYGAAGKEWEAKARPLHEAKAQEVEAKLKAAGISYRSEDYNGFQLFRLA